MTISRSIHVTADGIILFFFYGQVYSIVGFPGGSVVKNPPANAGDAGDVGFNIQNTKIMASDPITSWQIDGEKMQTVRDFIFLGS